MKKGIILFLTISILILIESCASFNKNIPALSTENSSAIAIVIGVPIKATFLNYEFLIPEKILFIKLQDEDASLEKIKLIESNYSYELPWTKIDSVSSFVMNVEPGTYAAVGAIGQGKFTYIKYFVYFPKEMIKKTMIHVEPNTFKYMGKYIFNTASESNTQRTDEIQNFYYKNLLFPEHKDLYGKQYVSRYKSPQYLALSIKEAKNAPNDEIEFLEKQRKYFKDTDWEPKILKRLSKLK